MYRISIFLLLFGIWIVFSGQFDAFHLALGLISTALVTAISSDFFFADRSRGTGARIQEIAGKKYDSDLEFRAAVTEAVGPEQYARYESQLVSAAIDVNPTLILIGILGFVASFAVSLGPVMWVLFSELIREQL